MRRYRVAECRRGFELEVVLGTESAWRKKQVTLADWAKTLGTQSVAAFRAAQFLEFVEFVELASRAESGNQAR